MQEFVSPRIEDVARIEDIGDNGFEEAFALETFAKISEFLHCAGPHDADHLVGKIDEEPEEDHVWCVFTYEHRANLVPVGRWFEAKVEKGAYVV